MNDTLSVKGKYHPFRRISCTVTMRRSNEDIVGAFVKVRKKIFRFFTEERAIVFVVCILVIFLQFSDDNASTVTVRCN